MYAVIMAGGSGTRFWPASRRDTPKQFLAVAGHKPMLAETCDRLKPIAREEEIIIVLGENHLKRAQSLLKGQRFHFLAEPVGRNTAPCIGLGALYASHLGATGPVAFLPADHYVAKPEVFLADLRIAEEIAETGAIVTLGIVPTRPETGYGYIRKTGTRKKGAYKVSGFVEKPDLATAEEYLASGQYFWNAGIFVAKPQTIMKEMEKHLPDIHRGLDKIGKALAEGRLEVTIRDVYQEIAGISFDYGIMERTREAVYVVPSECGWSDVGSWESLYVLRSTEHDEESNLSDGESILIDCRNCFVSNRDGRMVACLGLTHCLVVDTQDALLVADLRRSQDVREIIKRLEREGRKELL